MSTEPIFNSRIAFVGNQDNIAFRMCKWLRDFGFDCHLYIHPANLSEARSHPAMINPDCDIETCPWVHVYDGGDGWYPYFRKSPMSRQVEREFDAVVTSGSSIMYGLQFDAIPVFHQSLGGDIRDIPRIRWFSASPLHEKVTAFIYREAIRNCTRLFTGLFAGTAKTMEELATKGRNVVCSPSEDVRHNRSLLRKDLQEELAAKYECYDKVFLWLSRINYLQNGAQYKGADHFLRAFAQVCPTHKTRAVVGRHGLDTNAFISLARELGVLEYIDFIDHLPFDDLINYLALGNAVVFDSLQPKSNGIGGLTREALSLGTPVARSTNAEVISLIFGSKVPVNVVSDERGCREVMLRYLGMNKEEFAAEKQGIGEWAEGYLDYRQALPFKVIMHELATGILADKTARREFSVSNRWHRAVLTVQRALLVVQRKARSVLRGADVG